MVGRRRLRVVGGRDARPEDDTRIRAEARKRARPILRAWLNRIEHYVAAGKLSEVDYRTAKEMTNYPSANFGRCFAGQERIGHNLNRSQRTVRESQSRLRQAKFLSKIGGAPGKTATWFFLVDGISIFNERAFVPTLLIDGQIAAQDRQISAGLDRQTSAAKPIEQDEPIEQEPPHSPQPETERVAEIIGPIITFDEVWRASRKRGAEGFARTEFRKLDQCDLITLTECIRSGRADFRANVYVGTWLRDKVWLSDVEPEEPHESPLTACRLAIAHPGDPLWRAERDRALLAGETGRVRFLDARTGPITLRLPL
jgi:hypothetical protein